MTTFTPLANIPVTSRGSVKKSSGVLKLNLKLLGTSQDMEIVDDRAAAQIEEILAQSAIACAPSLPVTDVSEGMLNGDPFAQFGASLRRLLTLAKFDEQGFIGMDADTTSFGTGGALGFQGALSAGRLGKMDHATG